jgi:hypothetical protein
MSMHPENYEIEIWTDEHGNSPVETFLESLDEGRRAAADAAITYILGRRGPDVCQTEWGKNLGKGLMELRIRHELDEILSLAGVAELAERWEAPDSKVLLRVFFHAHGNKVVLLLSGYDKAADPSSGRQNREIDQARRMLRAYKREQWHPKKWRELWRARRKRGLVRFSIA